MDIISQANRQPVIGGFFNSAEIARLIVPKNQREYVWSTEQVENLWLDLKEIGDDEEHFLGSILLARTKDRLNVFTIVDGQQRLLTLLILFAVLKREFNKVGWADRAEALWRYYHTEKDQHNRCDLILDIGSHQTYLKLFLDERCEEVSTKRGRRTSERNIFDNYHTFIRLIEGEFVGVGSNNDKQTILEDILNRLKRIIAVRIIVNNEDDAYKVFETLNARSVELSTADLLKNLVLQKVSSEREEEALKYWGGMIARLAEAGQEDAIRFIRHYWLSKYKDGVREKNLYREIRLELGKGNFGENIIMKLLSDMNYMADVYVRVARPDRGEWEHSQDTGGIVYGALSMLSAMRVYQAYPFVMTLIEVEERKLISRRDTVEILDFIKRFQVRYSIANKSPSRIEGIYSSEAIRLRKATSSEEAKKIINALRSRLLTENPGDEEFSDKLSVLCLTGSNSAMIVELLKHINLRMYLKDVHHEHFMNKPTIEHITPEKFEDAYPNVNREDVRDYIERLGNLTLIASNPNRQASNKIFKDKLNYYDESKVTMTRELLKPRWQGWSQDPLKYMKMRHREIVDCVMSVYSLSVTVTR